MENFIYVFTKEERDALLASGYVLLRNDEKRNMYTFVNKGREDFECVHIPQDAVRIVRYIDILTRHASWRFYYA